MVHEHARQAAAAGTAKALVVAGTDAPLLVAYYASAMASITIENAPARLRRGAGRDPQPIGSLARLGVDVDHEGRALAVPDRSKT